MVRPLPRSRRLRRRSDLRPGKGPVRRPDSNLVYPRSSRGVSSHVCRACFVSTGLLGPLGGGVESHVTEICRGAAYPEGLLGRSTLAAVIHDALNGKTLCTTLIKRMACWHGPLGPLQGLSARSVDRLTIYYHVKTRVVYMHLYYFPV